MASMAFTHVTRKGTENLMIKIIIAPTLSKYIVCRRSADV